MTAAERSGRTAVVALAATLAIQVFTSLAATAPAVLAPELAREMGVAPQWIGVFVGLVYLGAMLASLVSAGFIERFGAIRVSQVCVLMCAAGIAAVGLLPAAFAGLLVAIAVLIGLGYGPITPASSQILVRTTPPSQMALMFSIKQTGVPVGAALAGAPTVNGLGRVLSGTVEQSNVDLGKEFVDMIITQRAFQANSRAITTSDEMLQELVNLKR